MNKNLTTDVTIKQMPAFKRAYKKLQPQQKEKVNVAIRAIIQKPQIGQAKKGDLASVFIHKFKLGRQEMLLTYEWTIKERLLLALGVYENFYRNLKKQS